MATAGGVTVRAGIYCRMSLARFGDTTKVEDQERICRELADLNKWDVAEVYTDNNVSAWKKNRNRPEWDRMLADVEAGKIGAIIVYHGDRLVRHPKDLETLIELAEGKGIRLASPTGERNLDRRDDRAMLRVLTAFAANESDAHSDRKKQMYERWRRDGRVRSGGRGGRPFGFKVDGVTHVPEETAVIRDAARRILMGESTGSVARSITLLTPAGGEFADSTVRKMLSRPRMAGLMPDGVSSAAWPPVLERAEWEMVRAVLDARASASPRPSNARKWLLSGIALCSECWTPLQIRQSKGRGSRPPQIGYGCIRDGCHKVYRAAAMLDAYVSGAVVARLNHPANPAPEIDLAAGDAVELAALTRRRAETAEYIARLADNPMQRIDILDRALESFDRKIGELRERMAGRAGERLLSAHAGITREGWDGLPLDARRALVRAVFGVVVHPASKRGPGFRPQDVTLTPA
jgi:site-specific DNA recombinase